MLKTGEMNNCSSCGASYSTYNVKTEGKDDWAEVWCCIPYFEVIDEKPVIKAVKGVCQFCNPKSKYYLNEITASSAP